MTPEFIHAGFKAKPGSEQIATVFAIRQVMKAVQRTRPRRILEVGAGIGTLTIAILYGLANSADDTVPELYYTEDDPTCREALEQNVPPEWMRRLHRIRPDEWIGNMDPFDLVIVDGEDPVGLIPYFLAERALVIVEGNRRAWRERLERFLDRETIFSGLISAPWVRLELKPWDRSKGVWLYQLGATKWECAALTFRHLWQIGLDAICIIACRVRGREPGLGKKRRTA